MRTLSRRDLLRDGTTGAAVLALAGAWTPAGARAANSALALAPRRAAVYGALMASLQGAPDGNLHADAARATQAFSGWYESQPPATRTHVDSVLDHLGARGLHRANASAGLKSLKNLSGTGRSTFTDREAVDAAAVTAALALAAQSAAPAPEADDAPVVGVLA